MNSTMQYRANESNSNCALELDMNCSELVCELSGIECTAVASLVTQNLTTQLAINTIKNNRLRSAGERKPRFAAT